MIVSLPRSSGPAADELEISVFGPGVGESVVVHLGGGDWMVVDSCRPPPGRPAALEYLDLIGVALERVRLVVATHWHDDHVRGLADILSACSNARFFCTAAALDVEFFELINAVSQPARVESSGVNEFRDILDVLARPPFRKPGRALGDMLLLSGNAGVPYAIHALSPSQAALDASLAHIKSMFPKVGQAPRRLPAVRPNESAVALWLGVGGFELLFGADLENTRSSGSGWDAVLASQTPKGIASAVKVAHHGSENGHHDEMWRLHIDPRALAVVTPYTRSGLPGIANLARLKSATPHVFVSSSSRLRKPAKRDAAVERTMGEVALARKAIVDEAGQVRLRAKFGAPAPDFTVGLFGSAFAA